MTPHKHCVCEGHHLRSSHFMNINKPKQILGFICFLVILLLVGCYFALLCCFVVTHWFHTLLCRLVVTLFFSTFCVVALVLCFAISFCCHTLLLCFVAWHLLLHLDASSYCIVLSCHFATFFCCHGLPCCYFVAFFNSLHHLVTSFCHFALLFLFLFLNNFFCVWSF